MMQDRKCEGAAKKRCAMNLADNDAFRRWYDEDPALSKALEQLRHAPDKYQAQVALNIIQIIVEHQMEAQAEGSVSGLEAYMAQNGVGNNETTSTGRRWYDVHEVLRSAMQFLSDCPDDLQRRLIPSIALMIEQTLQERVES